MCAFTDILRHGGSDVIGNITDYPQRSLQPARSQFDHLHAYAHAPYEGNMFNIGIGNYHAPVNPVKGKAYSDAVVQHAGNRDLCMGGGKTIFTNVFYDFGVPENLTTGKAVRSGSTK